MTRTVIWETPENREEYAETPCGYFNARNIPCEISLRNHGSKPRDHSWRIYRDIPSTAELCDYCGHELSQHSKTDGPCAECAARPKNTTAHRKAWHSFETAPPTTDAEPAPGDMTAPDTADTEGSGSASNLSDAGAEREQAARPRTFEEEMRWRLRVSAFHLGYHTALCDAMEASRYGGRDAIRNLFDKVDDVVVPK